MHNKSIKLKVKILLRSIFDKTAYFTGLLYFFEKRMKRGLTILMYHRILPADLCHEYPLESLVVPEEVFREQMIWLSNKFTVLPLNDALEQLSTGKSFRKPLIAITFDDGYYDNFDYASPILEEFGLRATFFVTSDFVKNGILLWFDRAALLWKKASEIQRLSLLESLPQNLMSSNQNEIQNIRFWMESLKKLNYKKRLEIIQKAESLHGTSHDLNQFKPMSVEQVLKLHDKGHEIASHTVSHQIMTQLNTCDLRIELINSAKQLSFWIGEKINGFCYPNGNYNTLVEKAVLNSDYEYSCTVEEGINLPGGSPTRLLRLPITMHRTMKRQNHDLLSFRAELCRIRSFLRI